MPSFQQTPLTQPLPPQISSPSQQPPLYSPVEEPQPPLMFQPSPLSQPPTSLPASMQNSTWDNPSFQQSSLDLAPSGGTGLFLLTVFASNSRAAISMDALQLNMSFYTRFHAAACK